MGTVVEVLSDDKGMIWPESIAPFRVHLLSLGDDEGVTAEANNVYEKLLKTEQILKYFPCINCVFHFPGCKTALDVPHYRSYVYPIYACASVFNRMSFFQSFVRNVKVNTERFNIIISVVEPEPVKINRPRAAAV